MEYVLKQAENCKKIWNLPLEDLNKKIEAVEKEFDKDKKELEKICEKYPLIYSNISDKIGQYTQEKIGIFLERSYKYDLKKYTAQFEHRYNLYYKIRDSITGFYTFANAEVNEKKIILKNCDRYLFNSTEKESLKIIKEYVNGRIDLERNEDLEKIITICKDILKDVKENRKNNQ
jgi:hypothetical protein